MASRSSLSRGRHAALGRALCQKASTQLQEVPAATAPWLKSHQHPSQSFLESPSVQPRTDGMRAPQLRGGTSGVDPEPARSLPMEVQRSPLAYFDHIYFQGAPIGLGQSVLAWITFLCPGLGFWIWREVTRLRSAFKGWEHVAPGRTRATR